MHTMQTYRLTLDMWTSIDDARDGSADAVDAPRATRRQATTLRSALAGHGYARNLLHIHIIGWH